MSILGNLLGDHDDTWDGDLRRIRESLAAGLRDGVDFDTAWTIATSTVGWRRGGNVSRHESLAQFARPRFERAYHGLDPSIPTCQAGECTEPATPAGQGVMCDLHRFSHERIDEVLADRQELIAA